MTFYSEEMINKIKSLETVPRVYESVFSQSEINELIRLEEESVGLRMVDRVDSRKTAIDWQSQVKDIIADKIESCLGHKIFVGDFPAHFIRNRFPLRIHADMGKDPTLLPYKNVLLPLYVKGGGTTHTILFKQKWYGKSSLFSANGDSKSSDHFFKDMNGDFVHIKNSQELLHKMKSNINQQINYEGGVFFCSMENIEEIEALLKQSRYSDRTNDHITSDRPFDKVLYNKYLSHQPYEDLKGLEIDVAMPWRPGDIITFNRSTIHCASNFLQEGVEEKMAIAMFTIWEE